MTPNFTLAMTGFACGILSMLGGPIVAGFVGVFAPFLGAIVLVMHDPEGP